MTILYVLAAIAVFYAVLWLLGVVENFRMTADLVRVEGQDSNTYYVKDLPNKIAAADLLATTRENLFRVVDAMRTTPDDQIPPSLVGGVRRIVRKHCNRISINELDATRHKIVAMNRAKGKEIRVCLRECPGCLELTRADRLLMVALHEIAHSGTVSYDPSKGGVTQHGDRFRMYEKYVIGVAESLGLLDVSAVAGGNYCGVRVPAPVGYE